MIALQWNNLLSELAMGACQMRKSAAIGAPLPEHIGLFPGSSVVEQLTVNQLVGGSNPSRGANKKGPPAIFRGGPFSSCQHHVSKTVIFDAAVLPIDV